MIEQILLIKCTFCGGANQRIRKDKGKYCADGDSEKQWTERTPHKYFRCGSEGHLIAKCPKQPKDNEKQQNQVCFNERVNRSLQKECDNGDDDNDQKIYIFVKRMSVDNESLSRYLSDSSQFTNWILYSGATCHITPQVSGFIPGLL